MRNGKLDDSHYPVLQNLIDDGNKLYLKASDQQGILSTALIAALGIAPNSVLTGLGIAAATCLAVAAGLSAGVHFGLGVWKISAAKKLIRENKAPRTGLIFLPTIAFALQSLSFIAGIILFIVRLAQH